MCSIMHQLCPSENPTGYYSLKWREICSYSCLLYHSTQETSELGIMSAWVGFSSAVALTRRAWSVPVKTVLIFRLPCDRPARCHLVIVHVCVGGDPACLVGMISSTFFCLGSWRAAPSKMCRRRGIFGQTQASFHRCKADSKRSKYEIKREKK